MIAQSRPLAMIRPPRGQNTGFSLVEVMVGMVIGLMTMIVIMQSYAAFEGQKRTTNNNSDTQENGLVAMHTLETDGRMAGFGLITPGGLACTVMNTSWNDQAPGLSSAFHASGTATAADNPAENVAPVSIVDGGAAGASDTITFTYSTSPSGGNPAVLINTMTNSDSPTNIPAANAVGFNIDQDLYLVSTPILSPGTGASVPCTRLAYTSNPLLPASVNTIYNPVVGHNLFPAGGYPAGTSYVLNMGNFVQNQYQVSNNDLTVLDVGPQSIWMRTYGNVAPTPLVLSSNIVNLQAQYGVAVSNPTPGVSSPPVTCWTNAAGTGCNYAANGDGTTWANPNAASIMRIKAVRIAVVARSSLQEKPASGVGAAAACNATTTAPIAWAVSGVGATPAPVINLNLPGDPNANPNWQCHRYRVYQTIIPLRNIIWANI